MTDADDLSDTQLPPGATLADGQYTITRFLASGGFGMTYMAQDTFGRDVVIKECFPAGLSRRADETRVTPASKSSEPTFEKCVALFLREAETLAALNSPHVVNVLTAFVENGTAYMVMTYVNGRDFQTIIDAERARLTPDYVMRFAAQLLDAVAAVHAANILHRDIKPGNILVDRNSETPVLIDFGAARVEATRQSPKLSTLPVVADGYSPNEFYVTGVEQGPASDLYSVAATLYAAVTGQAPRPAPERNQAQTEGQPDPVQPLAGHYPDYPAAFLESIDQSLALPRRDRIQSAPEWLARIAPVLPDRHNRPQDPTPTPLPPPPEPRRGGLVLASAAGLLLGAGAMAGATAMLARNGGDSWLTSALLPNTQASFDPLTQGQQATRAELLNAQAQITDLERRLQSTQAAQDALRGQLGDATARASAAEQALANAQDTARQRAATADTLRTQLQQANARVSDLETDLANAGNSTDAQVRALRAQLGAANADLAEARRAVTEAQSQAQAARAAQANAQDQVRTTQTQVAQLQAETDRLQRIVQQGAGQGDRIAGLQGDLAALQQTSRQQISTLQARLDQMQALLDAERAARNRAETRLATLENRPQPDPQPEPVALTPAPGNTASAWADAPITSDDLRGHSDSVRALAFSPDGSLILSGSNDNSVRLWNARTGRAEATLTAHDKDVKSVTFGPNGDFFATASDDGRVLLWDTASRRVQRDIATGQPFIEAVAIAPDASGIAVGLPDTTLRIWPRGNGAPRVFSGHTDWVSSVAYSPDGRIVATGSLDTTVRLWNPRDGTQIATLTDSGAWIRAVHFSPDGTTLYAVTQDDTVLAWDGTRNWALRLGPVAGVSAMDVAGADVVAGNGDGQVQLRDAQLSLRRVLGQHGGAVTTAVFSPDGRRIATGASDGSIRLISRGN